MHSSSFLVFILFCIGIGSSASGSSLLLVVTPTRAESKKFSNNHHHRFGGSLGYFLLTRFLRPTLGNELLTIARDPSSPRIWIQVGC